MAELKPCPFCGWKPSLQTDRRWPRYGKRTDESVTAYEVVCKNVECVIYSADNKYFLTEEEAVAAWNRRAGGEIVYCGECRFFDTTGYPDMDPEMPWLRCGRCTHLHIETQACRLCSSGEKEDEA